MSQAGLDLAAAEIRRADATRALSEACSRGKLRMRVPVTGYDDDVRIQSALNEYGVALDELRRLRAELAELKAALAEFDERAANALRPLIAAMKDQP